MEEVKAKKPISISEVKEILEKDDIEKTAETWAALFKI